jgi:hypothetical protein
MSGAQAYLAQTCKSDHFLVCLGCGAVVFDTVQHDVFHSKTRSVV